MPVATEPKSPQLNVEILSDEERRLMHEARVVAAALGEPLRVLVMRALRTELRRQRKATPDLLEALDRLRAQSEAAATGNGAYTGDHGREEAQAGQPAHAG